MWAAVTAVGGSAVTLNCLEGDLEGVLGAWIYARCAVWVPGMGVGNS